MKQNILIPMILVLVVALGCGLFGNKGVPNEQINTDLEGKSVKFNGGSDEWYFYKTNERCFQVNESESKISDSSADISLSVSSWKQTEPTNIFFTLSGKMVMHYRKEGSNWVLDRIEPGAAVTDSFTEKAEFINFLDSHTPVCKGYRHVDY